MGQDLDLQAKSTLLTMWKSESYLSSNVFPWRIFIWLLRKIVDLCRPQEWLWKSASVKTLHLWSQHSWRKQPGNAVRLFSQASSLLPGKDLFTGRKPQRKTSGPVRTAMGSENRRHVVLALSLNLTCYSPGPIPSHCINHTNINSSLPLSLVLCIRLLYFTC